MGITAVDWTIEVSLEAGVRHRVRWRLSDYCLHQKDGQRISLLTTHTHWDAKHTRTTLMLTPSCTFFFGVGVGLNKGHQSSSLGVFTLVWQRNTIPPLNASSACSHRACLKAVKSGNLCCNGEQSDQVSTKHCAPPVEQTCLFHHKPLWRRHLEVLLILLLYPNRHFRVVLGSRNIRSTNTSFSHTARFALAVFTHVISPFV